MTQADDLFGQNFQYIGRYLEQSAPSAYAVWSDTALEGCTDTTFHIDQHDGEQCIKHDNQQTYSYTLERNGQSFRHKA